MEERILVLGAGGQIGMDLVPALQALHGEKNIIAADLRAIPEFVKQGIFIKADALDKYNVADIVRSYKVTQIYMLAAMLSATGEQRRAEAWHLNMESLLNILEICRTEKVSKLFWPSSIAAEAPSSTVYGISKAAGELWCEYYFKKFGVDVRSLRYPGLISYTSKPGGGTTDYAVDIFHQAIARRSYTCFLKEDTMLPMMYMPDAIRATIELMEAPAKRIKVRTSYAIGAISFAPAELAEEIARRVKGFRMEYNPDHRQAIADSWPAMIDDSDARLDWGWSHNFDLSAITQDMLINLS